ncbi:uncharacterized protein IWZ02DRAFT_495283 [Phyllosticta citriasiana]|uniref:uncharacterized protein n=1 Tax=Phyllosticta citriasiana TaxID=595635 RepID=UPI0030FDDAE5
MASVICCGITKKGVQCGNRGTYDGFCHLHVDQAKQGPEYAVVRSSSSSPSLQHNGHRQRSERDRGGSEYSASLARAPPSIPLSSKPKVVAATNEEVAAATAAMFPSPPPSPSVRSSSTHPKPTTSPRPPQSRRRATKEAVNTTVALSDELEDIKIRLDALCLQHVAAGDVPLLGLFAMTSASVGMLRDVVSASASASAQE